jgi:hypothetical protein
MFFFQPDRKKSQCVKSDFLEGLGMGPLFTIDGAGRWAGSSI